MLGSNFNGDQNKLEKTIILVKTSNVEKLKSKKNKEKEFKRGSQRVKVSTQEEYRRQNRKRLMITFETEAGYNLLLADRKELSKLKTNSYLDLKFLEQNNKYRVHLYYKDKEKTRFSHWLPKYPQVKKTVEIDETDIRIKVDLKENSLSQAIDSIQTENDLSKSGHPKDIRHEKPPSPQELMKARKKVKVIENKTKSQLIVENSDLKASLESLRNDQVQTEKKMQVLLDEQDFYKSLLSEVIEKLSPKTKAQYEHVFDNTPKYKKGNSVENRNDMDNFYIDSPKSRIPTEKGMGENSATSSERIKEMDLFPAEEDISERQGNHVSNSFIHYDEVKYIEKTPSPDTPTGHAENLQALESSCPVKKINNKNRRKKQTIQKPLWSKMTKGVLTIWQAIKLAIQQGESEETLRKNKNTTNSWKPVLDPEYEHRQLFLAFLASG